MQTIPVGGYRKKATELVAIVLASVFATKGAGADVGADRISQRGGIGDPSSGKKRLSAEMCAECHGEDGKSVSAFAPNLAGQYAQYLVKQVHNFQSGERDNPIMNMMAQGIDDGALSDIAAYFASNERKRGEGTGYSEDAQKLFLNGAADRGILACAICHGANGGGRLSDGVAYPMIAGQRATYLRQQLANWRNGVRANSPEVVMNKIAALLTDAEIDALAEYVAGL